jgi:hypothetical protein
MGLMGDRSIRSLSDRWAVALIILALLVLPAVYVTSAGPMAWLVVHVYVSESAANTIFAPVLFVLERSEWFDRAWNRYMDLWQ